MKITAQDKITAETLKQLIEGTDDLSLAKGLAIGVIETLTDAAHQITQPLWEGLTNAQDLLTEIDEITECVKHDMSMFQEHTRNFEAFCEDIRKDDSE